MGPHSSCQWLRWRGCDVASAPMRVLLLVAVLSSSVVMLGCPQPACSSATCATGCCDASGACQAGTQPLACGIAGGTCSACNLVQQCVQGSCLGGTGAGGGGGVGGGVGGGGGGGTGTGGGVGIRLVPVTASVPVNGSVELSAELTGGAPNQLINWSVQSGGGSLSPSGPSTATYFPLSASATVRIRAQANFMSSLAAFADFAVSPTAQQFAVLPQMYSRTPYVLSLGSPQTFAAVRYGSPSGYYLGVRGVDWTVWPSGSITDGTVTATSTMQRIYAREQSSNVWASVAVSGQTTSEPSVAVTPSLSTVAPNGVVQLTATISTGAAAQWVIASNNGGTISQSGTYTAPSTPGVYVVAAGPVGGSGLRFGLATIIVQ